MAKKSSSPLSILSGIPAVAHWQQQRTAQKKFDTMKRLGHDSPNPWIKKSAEIPGWLFRGEHEHLYAQGLAAPAGYFIEVGSLYGKSTCILAGALKERGKDERLFAIDPFTKGGGQLDVPISLVPGERPSSPSAPSKTFVSFAGFAERFGYYDTVIPVGTLSSYCLPHLSVPCALAFLDARHDYDGVVEDFELVHPKMVIGGFVMLHDSAGAAWPGANRAIDDILANHPGYRRLADVGTIVTLQRVA